MFTNGIKMRVLSTYYLIVHEDSPVRLKKLEIKSPMQEHQPAGRGEKYQFGVKAIEDIPTNVFIPELLGLMASDTEADHSGLSEIAPHPKQTGPTEPRMMIGPLRFVNHICKKKGALVEPNVKVSY